MQFPLVLVFLSLLLYCSPKKPDTNFSDSTNLPDTTKTVKQSFFSDTTSFTAKKEKSIREKSTSINYQGVPSWYLENRVQVHTLLTLNKDLNKPAFFDYPKTLAKYGVPVLVRQIKASDEEPWWPSKVGTINPLTAKFNANGHNLAKDIITEMHDLNMKAIVYYRHIEDAEMLKLHPDWGSRDINGNLVNNKRGYAMCFNSPYRDVVIERLKELSSYGADGFYFDANHIPEGACFCKYCQALYKKQYGTDLIQDFKNGKKLQFYEFKNNTIDRFFSDIKSDLNQGGFNPVLIVSGSTWPALTDLNMNSVIFQKFTLKSELGVPARTINRGAFKMPADIKKSIPGFYLNALVYSFERDNSLGPPHIWCPLINTAGEANQISAGLISLGCIANLHMVPDSSNLDNFKEAISWDKKYGEHFKNLTPYSFTGILLSEKQRNSMIATPAKAWQTVLYPAYTAFEKLYDAGVPLQMFSDASLTKENANGIQQIFCNKQLINQTIPGVNSKLTDFKNVPQTSGKQLAISLNTPVFCIKDNPYSHFNYFTNHSGYIYAMYAPDFTTEITMPNPRMKANSDYTSQLTFKKIRVYHLYVKKENVTTGQLEDVVSGKVIKSSSEENGYLVFNIPENRSSSLGIIRFKSNL